MQHRLIDLFGGLHGVRDKGAVEAAVFRPQTGYYNSLEEEATALMESLANNHGFLDEGAEAPMAVRVLPSSGEAAFAAVASSIVMA